MSVFKQNQLNFEEPSKLKSIIRTRLISSINEAAQQHKICLCLAPAGYGKTSLLESYFAQCQHEGKSVSLIALTQEHRSSESFNHAIRQALSDVTKPSDKHLSFFEMLSNVNRANLESKHTLLLDVFENAECEGVNQEIVELLSEPKSNVNIVIAARQKPEFMDNSPEFFEDVALFDKDHLRFDLIETQEYLINALAPELYSDTLSAQVFQLTEGWPTATMICAVLSNRYHSIDFLENFSGQDSYLSRYFQKQIIAFLDKEQSTNCGILACFDKFSVSLVNAVLNITNAEKSLSDLYRHGVFIEPLDRSQAEYRFHPMFREYLHSTQWFPESADRKRIFRKASEWASTEDLTVLAIDYAIEAQDFSSAAQLLNQSAQSLIRDQGTLHKLISWCKAIPLLDNQASIELHFWLSWAFTFSWALPEADANIKKLSEFIEQSERLSEHQKHFYRGRVASASLALLAFKDNVVAVNKQSEQWLLAYSKEADPFDISVVQGARFLSSRLLLKQADARDAITDSKRFISIADSLYGVMWITTLDGLKEMEFGSYKVARKILEGGLETLDKKETQISPIKSTLALLLAKVVYEMGEFERARELLSVGISFLDRHGVIESAAAGISTSVKLELRHGTEKARYELGNLEYLSGRYSSRLKYIIQTAEIRILLQEENYTEAVEQARLAGIDIGKQDFQLSEDSIPLLNSDKEQLGIELLCYLEKYTAAQHRTKSLLAASSTHSRPFVHTRLLILYSAILYQQGYRQSACRKFIKAMKISNENGFFQVLVEKRKLIEPVLVEIIATRQHADLLTEDSMAIRLEKAFGLSVSVNEGGLSTSEKPTLSDREQEILLLLPSSMSVQEIADYLFLSKATIKTHLNRLYRKLGVKNRTGAITTSQRYNLLEPE